MIQIFVKVDSSGNIKAIYSGPDIVMTDPYHYCFIGESEIAENISQYKVVINDMVPALVLKEEVQNG